MQYKCFLVLRGLRNNDVSGAMSVPSGQDLLSKYHPPLKEKWLMIGWGREGPRCALNMLFKES